MKILDIDMDYFLRDIPVFISENSKERVSEEEYPVWNKDEVINFLENKLGLSQSRKIKGRIVVHHNEALYFWRELVNSKKLPIPFEVVHVDSHADLGLGYPSWTFILDSLLTLPVEQRSQIENYEEWFQKHYKPGIGDYLLFALAFRWISSLTYICNPMDIGNDYVWMILKDGIEPNDKIQLAHNDKMNAMAIAGNTRKYYETAIKEPEVDFNIIRDVESIRYTGDFDYITFCISPNYTPATADFIVEIIKDYIEEI